MKRCWGHRAHNFMKWRNTFLLSGYIVPQMHMRSSSELDPSRPFVFLQRCSTTS